MSQERSFTAEEIAYHSRINAQALAVALVAQGRQHGQDAEAVGQWLGGILAPGWQAAQGQGALVAARTAALNMVSLGATLADLSGDEREARATVSGWADADDLDAFDLARDDATGTFAVFAPIAASLGLDYRWEADGDAVTMVFSQR